MPKAIFAADGGIYNWTNRVDDYYKEYGKQGLEDLLQQIIKNYDLEFLTEDEYAKDIERAFADGIREEERKSEDAISESYDEGFYEGKQEGYKQGLKDAGLMREPTEEELESL